MKWHSDHERGLSLIGFPPEPFCLQHADPRKRRSNVVSYSLSVERFELGYEFELHPSRRCGYAINENNILTLFGGFEHPSAALLDGDDGLGRSGCLEPLHPHLISWLPHAEQFNESSGIGKLYHHAL